MQSQQQTVAPETAVTESGIDIASLPAVPIYDAAFAADPDRAYAEMRRTYGSMAPVELAPGVRATLVIGWATARRILNDPHHFPADPRIWQQGVDPGLSILPMIEYRPNALFSTGADHARYRTATVDALAGVDLAGLRDTVAQTAGAMVNQFCAAGSADLISQYVLPLVFTVVNQMLGCPPEISGRIADASAKLFDSVEDRGEVNAALNASLLALVALKRAEPGDDVTTRLLQHPVNLDDEEMCHQLVTFFSASIEPLTNLIVNTLLLMLTDPRWTEAPFGAAPLTPAAIRLTLRENPPLAHYCLSYPAQPILVGGYWLRAHEPVIIGMTACNNDPENLQGDDRGYHEIDLAYGGGVHECPGQAQTNALLIAHEAIDQLLDVLPELSLAVPPARLVWRPGPFHRALEALPVTFPQTQPIPLDFGR
ncbi:cytochrome P450 [Nocardia sp. NPDC057353]|uniref:cytochrome P450 n=1 Tax=Nocardia sp. NPDC057353 TaxID=3346104 RepID=UPI003630F970